MISRLLDLYDLWEKLKERWLLTLLILATSAVSFIAGIAIAIINGSWTPLLVGFVVAVFLVVILVRIAKATVKTVMKETEPERKMAKNTANLLTKKFVEKLK